ncbi:MAG: recombinase XerC, partial [Alphaproteobacteria bacterium]|nr:recombinase XerC [Alphaproteobacteria bacterium]
MRDSSLRTPRQKPLSEASRFSAAPPVAEEAASWLRYLAGERRASRHTVEAYGRDLAAFLSFLTDHFGERPGAAQLKSLQPADLRAYLAKRRRDGLESRSLLRALAAVRNFLRFLEKKGL